MENEDWEALIERENNLQEKYRDDFERAINKIYLTKLGLINSRKRVLKFKINLQK